MKIGYDAKRAFFNNRGLGNYSRTLIAGMIKFYSDDKYIAFTPTGYDYIGMQFEKKLSLLQIIKPKRYFFKKFSSLWRSFKLSDEIKSNHLDIFHGPSHELPYGIDKLNCVKIVTVHDLLYKRFPQNFSFIDRYVFDQKLKYACQHADSIIAICQQTKDDLVHLLAVPEDKIKVLYQSVAGHFNQKITEIELEKLKSKYLIKQKFILNVGALESNKNALTLLAAFDKIKHKIDEDLIFIGRGNDYKAKLLDQIKQLKLTSRVYILSDVTDEDLPGFYHLAQVFCFPSFFEGFGLPIVESFLQETPVVTSTGSCFAESGGDAAMYCDPHSADSFAAGLLKVLENKDLSRSMVDKGIEHAKKFNREHTSRLMHQHYVSLLARATKKS